MKDFYGEDAKLLSIEWNPHNLKFSCGKKNHSTFTITWSEFKKGIFCKQCDNPIADQILSSVPSILKIGVKIANVIYNDYNSIKS
jgi:hypothetical protein